MRKVNIRTWMMTAAFAVLSSTGFTSCSDDDGPSYSNAAVQNSELRTILTQKGYQFNEQGKLLIDDMVNSTTSLDLSGTNISQDALLELGILPNLTDVKLSDNGYGPVFDFAKLPAQVTGVDLTGNEIYDFEGLVDASVVNDELQTNILHNLTKLYLPETAKWNVEDMMPFYTKNKADGKTVDMQMVNDNGSLEAYTTLREVPDNYFRTFLKQALPKIFTSDDKIDISRPLAKMDMANFQLVYPNQYEHIGEIKSIEGIEYVINNPYYPENYVIFGYEDEERQFSVGYVMPRSNIKGLWLTQTRTEGLDLSKATNLVNLKLTGNDNLISLDLSNTLISNQDYNDFDHNLGNLIVCNNCEKLENVIFPAKNNGGVIAGIELRDLPSLKKLDLKSIYAMDYFTLLNLGDCEIVYPELTHAYAYMNGVQTLESFENTNMKTTLTVSQDVFDNGAETFIRKYREHLNDGWLNFRKVGAIRWSKLVD